MEPHELIVCRDVSLGYEGQTVLSHLNLTIRDGDYLCIVGDNGSGKSTLLRGLLGLLAPQSGEILRAPELERGAVGYLPQQTRAQRDFPATVLEVALSGCLNQKGSRFFYTRAQKSQALMNLGKLGVLEWKDKSYRELSGGQQQRVLLARALCAAGRLLILDEPSRRPGPLQNPFLSQHQGGHGHCHGDTRSGTSPAQRPVGASHRSAGDIPRPSG